MQHSLSISTAKAKEITNNVMTIFTIPRVFFIFCSVLILPIFLYVVVIKQQEENCDEALSFLTTILYDHPPKKKHKSYETSGAVDPVLESMHE